MAEKVESGWQGREYEFEFHPSEKYKEIANFIQACAAVMKDDGHIDAEVNFHFTVARADIPYSNAKNVNGWEMQLPAGFTTGHPRNSSLPLIVIQEGIFESGNYKEFVGILTHELAHIMFPNSSEGEVQNKAIRLLNLIDHNLEKFKQNPDIL